MFLGNAGSPLPDYTVPTNKAATWIFTAMLQLPVAWLAVERGVDTAVLWGLLTAQRLILGQVQGPHSFWGRGWPSLPRRENLNFARSAHLLLRALTSRSLDCWMPPPPNRMAAADVCAPFWDVTPCSPMEIDWRFGGTRCLKTTKALSCPLSVRGWVNPRA
jgi:hypothetical protein